MTSVEEFHDGWPESSGDHWSVMEHDNWAHCDE